MRIEAPGAISRCATIRASTQASPRAGMRSVTLAAPNGVCEILMRPRSG